MTTEQLPKRKRFFLIVREHLGLTRKELAKRLVYSNPSRDSIYSYETNNIYNATNPPAIVLLELFMLLGVKGLISKDKLMSLDFLGLTQEMAELGHESSAINSLGEN